MIDETNEQISAATLDNLPKDAETFVIKPDAGFVNLDFRELWIYRELLYFLAWRDVKVRYKQTVLGVTWVLLQPIATTLIFTVLFNRFNATEAAGIAYPLFSLSGFVLWTFFANAVLTTSNSIVNQANLITKVYFPRLIVPLAAVGSGLVDLFLTLPILLAVMFFYGANFSWKILLAPVFLALLLILTLGIGTILAALNVRFRDVKQVLPFGMQIWLFASPVFYPLEFVPEKVRWLWRLNPMTGILNGFRASLFNAEYDSAAIAVAVFVSFIILIAAFVTFRRMENDFADLI